MSMNGYQLIVNLVNTLEVISANTNHIEVLDIEQSQFILHYIHQDCKEALQLARTQNAIDFDKETARE